MSYLGKVALKASDIRRLNVTSSTSATHTLSWTPPNEQSLIITINGVKQQNNYSISGVTLTLDTALTATDEMEVIGINDIGTTNVPGSGVITNDMVSPSAAIAQSKLATLAIDTAELADDAVTADKLANSINTEIAANTAKVTNATHTGDVTGATALTIANDAVDIAMLSATGTASATTFLRGDNAWSGITETGTWTPVFAGSGTAGSFTYTAQIGHYTKIGNVVVAQFRVSISAISVAASGYLYIQGLPENAYEYPGITFSSIVGFTSGDTPSGGYIQNATNYMQLMRYDSDDPRDGWNTHCGGTALTTASNCAGTVVYRISV